MGLGYGWVLQLELTDIWIRLWGGKEVMEDSFYDFCLRHLKLPNLESLNNSNNIETVFLDFWSQNGNTCVPTHMLGNTMGKNKIGTFKILRNIKITSSMITTCLYAIIESCY